MKISSNVVLRTTLLYWHSTYSIKVHTCNHAR